MTTTVFFGAAAVIPAFLLTLLLTPLVLKIAHHKNWYDDPDHRKIHSEDIPRLGGVALFVSVMAMWGAFSLLRVSVSSHFHFIDLLRYLPFLAGMVIIHLVGLLDDFANLRARYKLIGQIIAGLFVVATSHYFHSVQLPFAANPLVLGPVGGRLFTLLWIVGITNAVNLIDGLDGLSGGVSALISLALALSAWSLGSYTAGFMAFFLFGALAGFLVYNLPPARIFMGDSGSLFLGFSLSIIPILAFRGPQAPFALPLGSTLLLLPIFDTLAAILRRIRRRIPLHFPDQEHLHHKLLYLGFSTRRILLAAYAATTLSGAAVLAWSLAAGSRPLLPQLPQLPLASALLTLAWLLVIGAFSLLDRRYKRRLGPRYYNST